MKKIFKSQKGSVTLYVAITFVVVTIILIGIYFSVINKQNTDLAVSQQIKATYEKDVNNVNEIYDNMIDSENTKLNNPISNVKYSDLVIVAGNKEIPNLTYGGVEKILVFQVVI